MPNPVHTGAMTSTLTINLPNRLGDRLALVRHQAGLSQVVLAKRMKWSVRSLQTAEYEGKITALRLVQWCEMCSVDPREIIMGLSVDDLKTGSRRDLERIVAAHRPNQSVA